MIRVRVGLLGLLVAGLCVASCGGESFEAAQDAGTAGGSGGASQGGSAGKAGNPGHGGASGGGATQDGGKETGGDASSCPAGFGDCDTDWGNGCETDLTSAPESCGKCGNSCLGGACVSSTCQPAVLVSPDPNAAKGTSISQDGDYVYFTVGDASPLGAVGRVSKAGGAEPKWYATTQGAPFGVQVIGGIAYWVDTAFHQVNKSDGATGVTLLTTATIAGRAFGVGGGFIYYTDLSSNQIYKIKADGLGKVSVATAQATSLALSPDGRLVFSTKTAVYLQGPMGTTTLGSQYVDVQAVDATSTHIAWSDVGAGIVYALPATETTPIPIAQVKANAIVLGAQYIFYVDKDAGVVGRIPIASGPIEELATGQDYPVDLAVDGSAVYWISGLSGAVYKVTK